MLGGGFFPISGGVGLLGVGLAGDHLVGGLGEVGPGGRHREVGLRGGVRSLLRLRGVGVACGVPRDRAGRCRWCRGRGVIRVRRRVLRRRRYRLCRCRGR